MQVEHVNCNEKMHNEYNMIINIRPVMQMNRQYNSSSIMLKLIR